MGGESARHLTDRELRALDLKEFLTLIQDDIHQLDRLRKERRKAHQEEKPAPPLESLPLCPVTCCGKQLGAFPLFAQVRCPFCGRWHNLAKLPKSPDDFDP